MTTMERPKTVASVMEAHEIETLCDQGNVEHKMFTADSQCATPARYSCRLHNCTDGGEIALFCADHLNKTVMHLRIYLFRLRKYVLMCQHCNAQLGKVTDFLWDIRSLK